MPLNTRNTAAAQKKTDKVFYSENLFGRDFTRHYDFSENQSRENLTRQSFVILVTSEKLIVTHDILSTTATFSGLGLGYTVPYLETDVRILLTGY